MNDSMTPTTPPTPTPTPAMQPESMHGPTHSHGSLHLIVGMLGVFLVLESIVLGYVVTQYVVEDQVETIDVDDEAGMDEEVGLVPPSLYIKSESIDAPYGRELRQVDRVTGEDTLVMDFGNTRLGVLVAVPQVGYDGRIYLQIVGEGTDFPSLQLYELDLTEDDAVPVPVELPISFGAPNLVLMNSFIISPDQTKLAYVPFNEMASEGVGPSQEIKIKNLLTGEVTVLVNLGDRDSSIAAGFTFSRYDGNELGATSGPAFSWKDNSCINAAVFESPSDASRGKAETFCE